MTAIISFIAGLIVGILLVTFWALAAAASDDDWDREYEEKMRGH